MPDIEDEAIRDLTRVRNDARIAERKAKKRLHSFLLRNDFIYSGKTTWIKPHFNWLATLKMKHPVQQVAFQEYIDAVHEFSELNTLRFRKHIYRPWLAKDNNFFQTKFEI